jgi:hypothetical protein
MIVATRQQLFVLPWFHFRYAEGHDSLVKLAFNSHTVAIQGNGLIELLKLLANHRVSQITEPTQNEARFAVGGITAISVINTEESEDSAEGGI